MLSILPSSMAFNRKHPATSLLEIRDSIDQVDRQLLSLLSERWTLAMSAVKFKIHEKSFRDGKRRTELLEQRIDWATQSDLPPTLIYDLFNQLIDNIEQHQEFLRKKTEPDD